MKYKFLRISLLSALAVLFSGTALGQTWTATSTAPEAGTAIVDNDLATIETVYATKAANRKDGNFGDKTFTDYIQVRTSGTANADNPTGGMQTDCTPLIVTAKQDVDVTFYFRRQAVNGGYGLNDGKDLLCYAQNDAAFESEENVFDIDGSYGNAIKTYKFVAGGIYTIYRNGSTVCLYAIDVVENVADEEEPEVGDGAAIVKMTWVDYDNPDTANGEVEIAQAGFNKISGGEVGFGNTTWGVNWITYLQVDASEYPGTITNATLTFEASGSTDSKRTTCWGVGYNSSAWSADMTYNTADKSITTIGTEQWTSTKSATVFESFTFDITEALKNAEDKVATILVYETAAAGGYLKNPVVTVSYTTAKPYAVTFTETNGVEATVMVNGSDVTNGTELPNGTYKFTATATGYKDYTGEFTVEGADKVVEFTMTEKAIYNYTVNGVDSDGNDLGIVGKGTGFEGETVAAAYPRYHLADAGGFYESGATNKEYRKSVVLSEDNISTTVTYNAKDVNVVFYTEGENIDGMTVSTAGNIPVRASNAAAGVSSEDILITTLPAGKYKFYVGMFTSKSNIPEEGVITLGVGDEHLSYKLGGVNLTENTPEECELTQETEIKYLGTATWSDAQLDYIYIVCTGDIVTGINTVNAKAENGEVYNLQGQKVEKAQKGLYIVNGKKMVVK